MSRQTTMCICFAFLTLVLGGVLWWMREPKETTAPIARVHMLDVGQGDSFFIEAANGAQLLIDGGADESVLRELSELLPPSDRSIDVVIATHPDADHIGGLPLVLARYDVELFLMPEVAADSTVARALFDELADRGTQAYYVRRGMMIALDDELSTTFMILFPDRPTSNWKTNAASVIGRLQIGERSMLFTGDAPSSVENFLVAADAKHMDVDILKVAHHGSKTSTSESLLRAATPALALVSAGTGNRYGHPAPEVTSRISRFGASIISTQTAGTYSLATDGVKWYTK